LGIRYLIWEIRYLKIEIWHQYLLAIYQLTYWNIFKTRNDRLLLSKRCGCKLLYTVFRKKTTPYLIAHNFTFGLSRDRAMN